MSVFCSTPDLSRASLHASHKPRRHPADTQHPSQPGVRRTVRRSQERHDRTRSALHPSTAASYRLLSAFTPFDRCIRLVARTVFFASFMTSASDTNGLLAMTAPSLWWSMAIFFFSVAFLPLSLSLSLSPLSIQTYTPEYNPVTLAINRTNYLQYTDHMKPQCMNRKPHTHGQIGLSAMIRLVVAFRRGLERAGDGWWSKQAAGGGVLARDARSANGSAPTTENNCAAGRTDRFQPKDATIVQLSAASFMPCLQVESTWGRYQRDKNMAQKHTLCIERCSLFLQILEGVQSNATT